MQNCKICQKKKYKQVQNCDKKVIKSYHNQPISKKDTGSLSRQSNALNKGGTFPLTDNPHR